MVSYPRAENIQSNKEHPALFAGFGGYNATGNLMFDFIVHYSKHFSVKYKPPYYYLPKHFEHKIENIALAMGAKISPPSLGRVKPYIGASLSLKFLQWDPYIDQHTGRSITPRHTHKADKKWTQSFDIGPSLGADLALGERLGLNVDFRYHISLFQERERKRYEPTRLDDTDSFVGSVNFRYYL